ncbi:hypothetical protein HHL25_22650 [Rhizobium sp. S-51]|uniref:Novel STAND NTPase 3 domain-containing protein n=1 Tax=Rhizobium terricola TaxID=2728849 RepID=A0A7Y0B0K4_9HYPH|nr:hypothetical protein [Rhizobium terricola]NML76946.1 hypothetical protein [Rhizobium terricola]
MTIAITAPEKFAFQDLVCVDIAHRFRGVDGATFIAEPKFGEDGTLTWLNPTGARLIAEIQVKGAEGTATLGDLAEYLSHFPDRSNENCLFERLLHDPNRRAVFVITARGDDQLLPFLHASTDDIFSDRPISTQVAQLFFPKLLATHPLPSKEKISKLAKDRRSTIASLKRFPDVEVASVLSRVFIIEQQNDASVEVRLQAALRAQRIDSQSLRGTIAHLTDIVSRSKRTQSDIIAPIVDRIKQLAPDSVGAQGYLHRGSESDLTNVLNSELVLLLTGQPRTGKTWIAKQIASALQVAGFEVRVGQHVDEAERFLTEAAGGERLYLLDDPLGSREPLPSASASLASLRSLAGRVPRNRRLIVAQSEPVLLQVTRHTSIAHCALGPHGWVAVGELSRDLALAVWSKTAEIHDVPIHLRRRVETLIADGKDLRDIGAIAYLAQTYTQLPPKASDADIVRQARGDAFDFVVQLAEKGAAYENLLRAIALATSNADGASDTELSFIINGGDDEPGLVPELAVWRLGGDAPPLPQYKVEPSFGDDQLAALDGLQRRRVIDEVGDLTLFSHPYLRAGAQALLKADTRHTRNLVKAQATRSIACLSDRVSLATARNLFWMRSLLPLNDKTGVSEAFDIACAGLRSIFPATRDESLSFVTSFADELTPELSEEIPHWAEGAIISLEDIDVTHGFGFINKAFSWLHPEPLSAIRPYLDALENGETLDLDLVLSKRLLTTLRRHPSEMGFTTLMRFLAADQAMVRAEAARVWFQIPRDHDEAVIAKLRNDAVPSIAVTLLKQLGRHWSSMSNSRRTALLDLLAHQANTPAIASVLFVRLVILDRVEHFGENPPYELLTSLMPHVLQTLPASVSFIDGRFANVVEEAIGSGCREELLPLLKLWSETIVKRLNSSQLSEFDLAIVDLLIGALSAESRRPIIEQLLAVDDTGALMVFISWLIKYWGELDDAERSMLKSKLLEPRVDQRWLQAVVLTSSSPPQTLLQAIFSRDRLDLTTAEAQNLLSKDQFDAAFYTYIGWPQPLWWYATHHKNSEFWRQSVKDLASDPANSLFEVALAELMRDPGAELLTAIQALPDTALDRVFNILLNFTVETESYVKETWSVLLERGLELNLEIWAKRAIEVAEAFKDLSEVADTFGRTDLTNRVIASLDADYQAFLRVKDMPNIDEIFERIERDNDNISRENLERISSLIADQLFDECLRAGPKLYGTWDLITWKLKQLNASGSTMEQATAERSRAIERHFAVKKSRSFFPPEPELLGWRDYRTA